MTDLGLGALRRLLGRISPAAQNCANNPTEDTNQTRACSQDTGPTAKSDDAGAGVTPAPAVSRERKDPPVGEGGSSPQVARLATAYLNLRAGEMLGLLVQELSQELAHELHRALDESRRETSAQIAEARESVTASQREISRMGREMVRAGATLGSIETSLSALGPALERMEGSLRAELARENVAREQELRREAEMGWLDDVLATLDGLELGLQEGRELVQELTGVDRRLSDATVKRWWRAMGEATGIKRTLPEVPLSEVQSWMEGLQLTYRRLQDSLARRGVTPIEAVGKLFDPYLHEAVGVEPGPPEQEGLVVREQRKGYRTSDLVVRLSQVVVGRAAPTKAVDKRSRSSLPVPEPTGEDSAVCAGESSPAQTEQREVTE